MSLLLRRFAAKPGGCVGLSCGSVSLGCGSVGLGCGSVGQSCGSVGLGCGSVSRGCGSVSRSYALLRWTARSSVGRNVASNTSTPVLGRYGTTGMPIRMFSSSSSSSSSSSNNNDRSTSNNSMAIPPPPPPASGAVHTKYKVSAETLKLARAAEGETLLEQEIDFHLPVYTEEEKHGIKKTHLKPKGFVDYLAWYSIKLLGVCFNIFSGHTYHKWKGDAWNEQAILRRCIFLETLGPVPGFSAAMVRHLWSLRHMACDKGWIGMLLEEAENERMHLLTFMQLLPERNMTFFFKWSIIVFQFLYTPFFTLAYLISPRFAHRFIAYMEEEAVGTYSEVLEQIQHGALQSWKNTPAPPISIAYWKLGPDATMYDVLLVIRADEDHHRHVNHVLCETPVHDKNPFHGVPWGSRKE